MQKKKHDGLSYTNFENYGVRWFPDSFTGTDYDKIVTDYSGNGVNKVDKQSVERMRKRNPFLSLSDIVYDLLLQEIVSFRMAPGSRVNESTIAELLGVSRSPVKNALTRLMHNSYVVRQPGYRVAAFSEKEYTDIAELSELIEPYAAGRAAIAIKDTDLDVLYGIAGQLQHICVESGNLQHRYIDVVDLEYQFHSRIVHLADHPLLEEFYEHIKYKLYRYRNYLNYDPPSGYFDVVGTEHLTICDILKMRDQGMAEAIMRRHLALARAEFKRKFPAENNQEFNKKGLFSPT